MYTIGLDHLPEQKRTDEAIELMGETLSWVAEEPQIRGLNFTGEVYRDIDDSTKFEVLGYSGLITSLIPEPPSFNLLVSDAWQQVEKCDCGTGSFDAIFEDFELAMEQAELSEELDQFAGVETKDPHYETVSMPANSEVTIRFDRLGAYGVNGILK